jgi:hypothetical protein
MTGHAPRKVVLSSMRISISESGRADTWDSSLAECERESSMPLGRYRLKNPTLALHDEGGRHVARTVPAGAVVLVDGATFDGNKLVEVSWDGTKVMMFTEDLKSRADLIK